MWKPTMALQLMVQHLGRVGLLLPLFASLAFASTPGITCRYFGLARDGDTCSILSQRYRISDRDLVDWNADRLTWENCDLIPGTEYCVASDRIPVSTDGLCGYASSVRAKCETSKFGECCSAAGYCGDSMDHCGIGNCQSGACVGAGSYSYDGLCGPLNGKICGGAWGVCCSRSGFCGSSTDHCGAGCYSGNCTISTTALNTASSTTTEATAPTSSQPTNSPSPSNTTTDGQCATNGKACNGSSFGDCCSSSGYCGNSDAYCGSGCNPSYGKCNKPTNISPDGTCGAIREYSCTNSNFGTCCSSSGYCGSAAAHCGQGCQPKYGKCITGQIPSNNGECGTSRGNYTCAGGPFDGTCCSIAGYCGSTVAHCAVGCQGDFGKCT
ncbi:uncharacterized protein EI97DRAFT_108160 [Westerdykella ornata]|uniref:Carbohydrate-binding module family 18 protein n=1 Tax=Westerdykella ornata TaxID=318751 RepID=A0A6A6JTW5_WESOR|nr:uncharacterized protein EI97DRAFT_108160 [Westerdykella ornata]KAF2280022.1 hypothetical protein EI97DRAFT_108160 [Westerdykella ornata]